jgi:polyisoprenoid-binding protein YceI
MTKEPNVATAGQLTPPELQDLLDEGALSGDWTLDPQKSEITLKSRTLGALVVKGAFKTAAGSCTVSAVRGVRGIVSVGAASIDTGNKKRDDHLRSADFFDIANYPEITFTVEEVRPSGRGVTISGRLTVRDRTKNLSFDAKASVSEDREVWLDAEVLIDRADFGIMWNWLGLVSMRSRIAIHAVFTTR